MTAPKPGEGGMTEGRLAEVEDVARKDARGYEKILELGIPIPADMQIIGVYAGEALSLIAEIRRLRAELTDARQALDCTLTADDYERSRKELWEQAKRLEGERDAARAELERVTKERDAFSTTGIDLHRRLRLAVDERDAALARAEKAERERDALVVERDDAIEKAEQLRVECDEYAEDMSGIARLLGVDDEIVDAVRKAVQTVNSMVDHAIDLERERDDAVAWNKAHAEWADVAKRLIERVPAITKERDALAKACEGMREAASRVASYSNSGDYVYCGYCDYLIEECPRAAARDGGDCPGDLLRKALAAHGVGADSDTRAERMAGSEGDW